LVPELPANVFVLSNEGLPFLVVEASTTWSVDAL